MVQSTRIRTESERHRNGFQALIRDVPVCAALSTLSTSGSFWWYESSKWDINSDTDILEPCRGH